MVSRRRSSTRRGSTPTGSIRRRPSSGRTGSARSGYRGRARYPTSRGRRGTAASFGSAFGLLLVYLLLRGSWPARIGGLLLGLVLLVGYLLLTRPQPAHGPDPDAPQAPDDQRRQESP